MEIPALTYDLFASGTVRRISPASGEMTLGRTVDAYLVTLRGAEIFRVMAAEFCSVSTPDEISAERFTA